MEFNPSRIRGASRLLLSQIVIVFTFTSHRSARLSKTRATVFPLVAASLTEIEIVIYHPALASQSGSVNKKTPRQFLNSSVLANATRALRVFDLDAQYGVKFYILFDDLPDCCSCCFLLSICISCKETAVHDLQFHTSHHIRRLIDA